MLAGSVRPNVPAHRIRASAIPAAAGLLVCVALVITSRSGNEPPVLLPLPSAAPDATVLLAVGDVAWCSGTNDEDVGWLAAHLPGTIALLGDIAYPDGSASDFADCFDPAWTPMLPRIRPAPGNHEYQATDASGYFSEFGAAAGTPGEGWYSYELGGWHVVVLNSNCEFVGGCRNGSPQLAWLQADLRAHRSTCTLAYWHHPLHSSGLHENEDAGLTDALWRTQPLPLRPSGRALDRDSGQRLVRAPDAHAP